MADYLPPADLAARLHVTTRTLTRWRRIGIGPAWIREEGTNAVRYSTDDVAEWAGRHRHGATHEPITA